MASESIPPETRALLERAYARFNDRDIDAALDLMTVDVEWANGQDGGYVHGREGVRAYWTRQWQMIDPEVTPLGFAAEPHGAIKVEVHQIVRDLDGALRSDRTVFHVYTLSDGRVSRMEIREG